MKKFLWEHGNEKNGDVVVFGVPLGRNSKEALKRLRETSEFLEPFDIEKKMNLLENLKISDIGDLKLKSLDEITKQARKIAENRKIPLVLGGNHLLSLYSIKAFDNVKAIVFDAHADLKNRNDDEEMREMNYYPQGKFDTKTNEVTWLRRLCENVNPKNILMLGTRSCDEFELEYMKKNSVRYFTPRYIEDNMETVKKAIKEFTTGSKVYISIDLDAFDPSIAPAVDHPEPDGLLFRYFYELVNSIKGKVVGMDMCCLKPIKDNQVTEFLAIKIIFAILGLAKQPNPL
jgi:agmatinase